LAKQNTLLDQLIFQPENQPPQQDTPEQRHTNFVNGDIETQCKKTKQKIKNLDSIGIRQTTYSCTKPVRGVRKAQNSNLGVAYIFVCVRCIFGFQKQ